MYIVKLAKLTLVRDDAPRQAALCFDHAREPGWLLSAVSEQLQPNGVGATAAGAFLLRPIGGDQARTDRLRRPGWIWVEGREKQFAAVASSEQYTMGFRYSNERGNATDKDEALKMGAAVAASRLKMIIAASSEFVPISAFNSRSQYQQELKGSMSRVGEALKEKAGWKFSVSSGELEIPVSKKVGNVEITAGSIDLYEVAGKVTEDCSMVPHLWQLSFRQIQEDPLGNRVHSSFPGR